MTAAARATAEHQFLGIECGATRTVALLADARGQLLDRWEAGPANLRLLTAEDLSRHLRALRRRFPRPDAVGIGMAGVREESERRRVREAAGRVWPGVPCYAGNDLETGWAAAEGAPKALCPVRVLIISGTGSCCYGRTAAGVAAKVGGWGHWLGDKGSGYDLGLRALKAAVYYFDRDGVWPALGARLLRALQLNEPNQLIDWLGTADKPAVAALAIEVFAAWAQKDRIAADLIHGAAAMLAHDATACARRLARTGTAVDYVLTGSVLLKQPRFAKLVARELRRRWPRARVWPLPREGAWGAVTLARQALRALEPPAGARGRRGPTTIAAGPDPPLALPRPRATGLSPTEGRNPRSLDLDRRPLASAIALMLREEARVPVALMAHRRPLEQAVRGVVRALRRGGKLFYVGAGTSGRLGVLDASECPPTFGVPPDQVQGIMAGGATALWTSVEGAEDDAAAGARAVGFRGVTRRDVVLGIAASGRTPFVWGALHAARAVGATTMLLCFNPHLAFPRGLRPNVVLAPVVGPEILTGSTRLKAGTATKLVLNLISTLAMTRLGKVRGNLMVDLNPSNTKLRDRAVRITQALTGTDAAAARAALERAGWVVTAAVAACQPLAGRTRRVRSAAAAERRPGKRNGSGR